MYHANPFITRPDRFPQDPLFPYIAWTTTPSVYGPAMIDLAWLLTWIAQAIGGSPGIYVLVYKLAAFGAYLGSIVVVHKLLDAHWPARAAWGTLAYAWHPLVLIELVGSGHNDSFLILLLLLALLLAQRERRLLTVLLLVLAGLVKLVALALVPLYMLYVLREAGNGKVGLLLRQSALGITVVAALYAPYWVGPQTLNVLVTAPPLRVMRSGPAAWTTRKLTPLICAGRDVTGVVQQPPAAPRTEQCAAHLKERVRLVSLGLFVLVYAALLLWPMRSFASLTDRAVWVLVAYICLAAISFRSWYVTWVLACVPFMQRPRALLLLWGCAVFLDYSRLPIWDRDLLSFLPVLLLIGGALGPLGQRLLRRAASPSSASPTSTGSGLFDVDGQGGGKVT